MKREGGASQDCDVVRQIAVAIDERVGKNYGNAQVFELSKGNTVKSFLWERLGSCTYWFIYDLLKELKNSEYIEDVFVWNPLQPARIGEESQPISIEIRIQNARDELAVNVAKRTAPMSREMKERYLPHATLDDKMLASVKDKTVRKAMKDVVQAIFVGEDPDQCRNLLKNIIYLHEDNSILMMLPNPPTLSFTFLKSLMERFSSSLRDIRYERINSKSTGLASGAGMIFVFKENCSNVLRPDERMYRSAGRRQANGGFSPY